MAGIIKCFLTEIKSTHLLLKVLQIELRCLKLAQSQCANELIRSGVSVINKL